MSYSPVLTAYHLALHLGHTPEQAVQEAACVYRELHPDDGDAAAGVRRLLGAPASFESATDRCWH